MHYADQIVAEIVAEVAFKERENAHAALDAAGVPRCHPGDEGTEFGYTIDKRIELLLADLGKLVTLNHAHWKPEICEHFLIDGDPDSISTNPAIQNAARGCAEFHNLINAIDNAFESNFDEYEITHRMACGMAEAVNDLCAAGRQINNLHALVKNRFSTELAACLTPADVAKPFAQVSSEIACIAAAAYETEIMRNVYGQILLALTQGKPNSAWSALARALNTLHTSSDPHVRTVLMEAHNELNRHRHG